MASADWVAKVREQLDDLRRKRASGLPDHGEAAEQAILADEGNREQGPVSGANERTTHSALGGRCQDVRHLDRLLYLREPSGRSFPFSDWRGEHRLDDLGLEMLGGAWHEDLAWLVVLVDHPGIGARELRGPGHDRAQHGPEIQGGTDRLTDLAERSKFVHRARQLLGSGFELLEQADVFNRDHGLIGEGLEERDLSLREKLGLGAAEVDRTDRDTFSHQWDTEVCVNALPPRERAALREFVCLGLQVSNVNSLPIEHRSTIDRSPDQWEGRRDGNWAVVSDEPELLALPAEDGGVERLAEARGALRQGIEHRLDVRRRAADDPKDLAGRCLLLQRLAHLGVRFRKGAVLFLQFREQAHILDGDDGLARERPEEGDLICHKPAGLDARDRDRPDNLVSATHQHHYLALVSTDARVSLRRLRQPRIRAGVGDVQRGSLADGRRMR